MQKRMLIWTFVATVATGVMVYWLLKKRLEQTEDEMDDSPRELIRTTGYGGGEYTL